MLRQISSQTERRASSQIDASTTTPAEADAFLSQLLCQKNHAMHRPILMSIASSMLRNEREEERPTSVGRSTLAVGYPTTMGIVYVVLLGRIVIQEIAVALCIENGR